MSDRISELYIIKLICGVTLFKSDLTQVKKPDGQGKQRYNSHI